MCCFLSIYLCILQADVELGHSELVRRRVYVCLGEVGGLCCLHFVPSSPVYKCSVYIYIYIYIIVCDLFKACMSRLPMSWLILYSYNHFDFPINIFLSLILLD